MNAPEPAALWTSFKVRLAAVVGVIVLVVAVMTTAASAAGAPAYAVVTVSVLVALVLTHTLARGMTAPVREMTDAATSMARGDYSTRVGVTAADEIGELARAFNAMAEELQTEDRRRRELVATVSHELRTPVAALRATLENLADGVVAPSEETLGAPLRQAERLSDVVGDLLDLSRLDAGLVALEVGEVDAAALLGRVADEARLATRRPVTIVAEADHHLTLVGDGRRLHQLLANLVDNAVRHSPEGGTVTLSARATTGGTVLAVHDQGPGIPPEHRDGAFRAFRTGTSGEGGGTGLGLAVAHWVTVLHGGGIRVVDDPERPGCTVRVELPATPPARPAPSLTEEAPMTTTPAAPAPPPAPPAYSPSGRPGAMDAAFGNLWPEPRPQGRPSAVLTALAVGVWAGLMLPFHDVGLGWWLVLVAMIGSVAWTARARLDRYGWVLLGLATALTLPTLLLDAGWIVTLCVLAAGLLVAIALTGSASVLGFVWSPVAVGLAGLRGLPWLGRSLEAGGGAVSWKVARTAVVSLALVLVFGTLLGSADALYGSWLGRLVPDLRVDTLFARGFCTVFVGGVTLAALYVAVNPPRTDLATGEHRPRQVWEWLVPVALVDVLLVGFAVAQATALFGGRSYLERTVGMTYAEYVHQGFGQLVLVSILTIAVAAAAWRLSDHDADRWALRTSVGVLCVLTLLVVASALMRIGLYDDAYGWTRLRVLVAFFEGWVGLVVVLVMAAGLVGRASWLPRTALATGAGTLLLLAALNPDARIAQHNLAREGSVPTDTSYLVGLSQDAIPALSGDERERACATRDRSFAAVTGRSSDGLWSWNLGRWRADRACDG